MEGDIMSKCKTKKIKTNYDLLKEIRNQWTMNPVTRVQENEKKNNKKIRQGNKKECNKLD